MLMYFRSMREPVDLDLDGPLPSRRAPGNASESQILFGALVTILTLATEMKRLSAEPPQKENMLAREQTRLEGALARKEAQVEDLSRRLAERISAENARVVQADRHAARLQQDYGDLRREKDQLQSQKDQLQSQLEGITSSRAWKLLTVLHKFRLRIAKLLGSG